MNQQSFAQQKQDAILRMQKMNAKSKPAPSEPTPEPKPQPQQKNNSLFDSLNIPILSNLRSDSDTALILGILLLLLSEKADKKLLFALIYILL